MRKITLTILSIIVSIFSLNAQNFQSLYDSNEEILSSVMVNSPLLGEGKAYMVGTLTEGVFITKMDISNEHPEPLLDVSKVFNTGFGEPIYLSGGFADPENNIVLYGYTQQDMRGVIMKIILDDGEWPVVAQFRIGEPNTVIASGTWVPGNYVFASAGKILRVNWGFTQEMQYFEYEKYSFSCLSFSEELGSLIGSGYKIDENLAFIGKLNFETMQGDLFYYKNTYSMDRKTISHVISENGRCYLSQDVSHGSSEGIWLTHVNLENGELYYNKAVMFFSSKTWIVDLGTVDDRPYVLATMSGFEDQTNFVKRYVVDFMQSSEIEVRFMDNINLNSEEYQYRLYQGHLRSITTNNAFGSIMVNGAIGGRSFMKNIRVLELDNNSEELSFVETDLNYDKYEDNIIGESYPYQAGYFEVAENSDFNLNLSSVYSLPVGEDSEFQEELIPNSIEDYSFENINVYLDIDGNLIAENIGANCELRIIDMAGKLCYIKDNCHNEIQQPLNLKNGIYVVKLDNDFGSTSVKINVCK